MADRLSRASAFVIALVVFALDRWSKRFIETHFSAFDTRVVIPGFFNLVRSENPGVAFGLFARNGMRYRSLLLVSFSLAAVVILAFMLWRIGRLDRRTGIGLSLVFGGALGNVYDRFVSGAVTDFLDFYAGTWHWYTFNLADTAICAGAGLLMLSMLAKPQDSPVART